MYFDRLMDAKGNGAKVSQSLLDDLAPVLRSIAMMDDIFAAPFCSSEHTRKRFDLPADAVLTELRAHLESYLSK